MSLFAPRMWRCFYDYGFMSDTDKVCSTHVEMFPTATTTEKKAKRLLHACGDVSTSPLSRVAPSLFAPRMWRCFQDQEPNHQPDKVCSTHVEMFLLHTSPESVYPCLLHACGDVSTEAPCTWTVDRFAPRMWRCFFSTWQRKSKRTVCSTHVEMFPPTVFL